MQKHEFLLKKICHIFCHILCNTIEKGTIYTEGKGRKKKNENKKGGGGSFYTKYEKLAVHKIGTCKFGENQKMESVYFEGIEKEKIHIKVKK